MFVFGACMTTSPILHHYPQSPASEKVRVFMGLKNIEWRSVIIPRVPPKPKLTKLTGGFRLTPVMQMGADIYCDTSCIISELEHRFPTPSMISDGTPSTEWHIGAADDGDLFKAAIAIVFSDGFDHMPEGFAEDRVSLYFDDADQETYFRDALDENLTFIRSYFTNIDKAVESQNFIGGDAASISDAVGYYIAWFLRGRYSAGPELISAFPNLEQWEARISEEAQSTVHDHSADAALEEARASTPLDGTGIQDEQTLGLQLGQRISVRPEEDPNVSTGELISLSDRRVSILRSQTSVGDIAVHFPRQGYVIAPAD